MTDNFIKNSFDKLLFSYPNNTISYEDNNNKQDEKTENVNSIKEPILFDLYQLNTFNDLFCNEDCSKKFQIYVDNNLNNPKLSTENKNELLKILLANAYNSGYNKGISNSKINN